MLFICIPRAHHEEGWDVLAGDMGKINKLFRLDAQHLLNSPLIFWHDPQPIISASLSLHLPMGRTKIEDVELSKNVNNCNLFLHVY
jgi:hypothetical protein